MASTYTGNTGIEKIGSGEQAGTWGTTTNTNFDIIDRALHGVGEITLAGTAHTLTTTDGAESQGQFKVLKFTGSFSGENTVTITPNDQSKFYVVHNTNASHNVKMKQGSGATVTVPPQTKKLIYAEGGGASSAVIDITSALSLDSLTISGTTIAATGTELNKMDGDTSATSTTIADADRLIVNDDGTMVQAAVTDISTYMNANAYLTPTTITASTETITPSAAKSIYQRVDATSNNVAVTLAAGSLAIGQYIIVDKIDTSSNTMTMTYPANNQGITLGSAAELVIAIYNGTSFSFVETIKS